MSRAAPFREGEIERRVVGLPTTDQTPLPLEIIYASDWEGKPVPERQWIVRDWIPMVDMSPVDTGRFRGNWQVEIGRDPTAELPDKDKSGNPTKEKGTATVKGCPPFQPVYIANNLPYGPTLNDGHSKQAPAGFVEIAVDQVVSPFQ